MTRKNIKNLNGSRCWNVAEQKHRKHWTRYLLILYTKLIFMLQFINIIGFIVYFFKVQLCKNVKNLLDLRDFNMVDLTYYSVELK